MKSWTLIDWAIYLILCLVCGYFNGQLSLIQMKGFLLSFFNVSDNNEKNYANVLQNRWEVL
ncbi:predicted protein [Enterococcus faecium Com15]|nr:predicted protein [Enterococcus faecium Com15]